MNQPKPDNCFNCGSTENLTKDHIPPKSFFPPEHRENLITVTCCEICNSSFSKDDEAFRIFAAANINRSKAGDWIWKHGVMDSSFKRSEKLKQHVVDSLLPVARNPDVTALRFPEARANNFLVRITKGLMRHYYPDLDCSGAKFEVTHLVPDREIIDNKLSRFIYDERGNGVFRFWRACRNDKPLTCVWVYVVYDGLMFMVDSI